LIPYLCLGLPGGALFEHYILTRGKTSHAQLLERALLDGVPLTPEDSELFQEHYSLLFWFDSIRHMHQLNQKCARPLAIWTLLQEYRGLSRIGRHINSSVDIALPLRTYDRYKKLMVKEFLDLQAINLKIGDCILVSDNFSHSYRLTTPDPTLQVPYKPCNWTVNALQVFEDVGHLQDFLFKLLPDQSILPSFPSKLADLEPYFDQVFFILSSNTIFV